MMSGTILSTPVREILARYFAQQDVIERINSDLEKARTAQLENFDAMKAAASGPDELEAVAQEMGEDMFRRYREKDRARELAKEGGAA